MDFSNRIRLTRPPTKYPSISRHTNHRIDWATTELPPAAKSRNGHLEVVRVLVGAGADKDKAPELGQEGSSWLHVLLSQLVRVEMGASLFEGTLLGVD